MGDFKVAVTVIVSLGVLIFLFVLVVNFILVMHLHEIKNRFFNGF